MPIVRDTFDLKTAPLPHDDTPKPTPAPGPVLTDAELRQAAGGQFASTGGEWHINPVIVNK